MLKKGGKTEMKGMTALLIVCLTVVLMGCQHPTPPQIPSVEPPAQTEGTPNEIPTATSPQPESQMPVLEVVWEKIQLPSLRYEHKADIIEGFLGEEGGKTISVYRCIGPADDGKASLYSRWQSKDGFQTWFEVEQVVIYPDQAKQLGFAPSGYSWGGTQRNPYLLKVEEILTGMPDPLTDFGNPYLESKDPTNPQNILVISWYWPFDDSLPKPEGTPLPLYRLFLSLEGYWYQVNFPPYLTPYDVYPNTPQLTLLKIPGTLGAIAIKIFSTDNGLVEVLMADTMTPKPAAFWKATVNPKSPN